MLLVGQHPVAKEHRLLAFDPVRPEVAHGAEEQQVQSFEVEGTELAVDVLYQRHLVLEIKDGGRLSRQRIGLIPGEGGVALVGVTHIDATSAATADLIGVWHVAVDKAELQLSLQGVTCFTADVVLDRQRNLLIPHEAELVVEVAVKDLPIVYRDPCGR